IAWSDAESITVRGKSLSDEILGHMDVGDFSYFQLTGTEPTRAQSAVYNAMIVSLVEHGITPSVIAARMAYAAAPEALQAAVAAGLAGLGTVFVGSMEGASRMLYGALPLGVLDGDVNHVASDVVDKYAHEGTIIPGIGHPLHKDGDPRASK